MARTLSPGSEQRARATRRPQGLATRLADFACRLRSVVLLDLNSASSAQLAALYQQARKEMLPDLTYDDFADLLAQVLIYCSLVTRCSAQERCQTFTQACHAFLALPALPPFVALLLTTLWRGLESAQGEMELCIKDLTTFLDSTDMHALLKKLDVACSQSEALIYFYELFLTAYAPRQRSQRGVYYTPAPVIAYMVRALDGLLRKIFAYPGGLTEALQDEQADGGVLLCDPACGTGAFLWGILDYAHQMDKVTEQSAQARLSGYEIMPAAYLLTCIELAMRQTVLARPGGTSTNRAMARISLVNALADASPLVFPGSSLPIIVGNPPYAGHSLNHSNWLGQLLENYKMGDGSLKKPAQTKWLNDDYVQFLRLAQWQIDQVGRGIVAFLTSHSYLDNPTFRAMRLSLLRSFDEIYIVNLHGNSKRRERTPNGSRDHNIFTIQQGVAIGIFVKRPGAQSSSSTNVSSAQLEQNTWSAELCSNDSNPTTCTKEHLATIHYTDVWGERACYVAGEDGTRQLSGGKLGWLAQHDLDSTPWQTSHPSGPFYLFTPRDERYQAEYMANWSLPSIFALNGDPAPGLVTCHDEFAISWNSAEAVAKIDALLATDEEAQARNLFHLCTQSQWDYTAAKRELKKGTWQGALGRIHYRPFDTRWTVFERHVAVHLRERVTRQMRAGPNLALAVGRAGQVIDGGDHWDIAFCSRLPTEFNLYRRGGNYLFPLYLYSPSGTECVANLAPQFIAQISQHLNLNWLANGCGDLHTTFGPNDVFAYIYALLYAPSYRARYANFLKIDFPRIPLPTHADLFRTLCSSGHALSQAHLLDQPFPTQLAWSLGSEHSLVTHTRYLMGTRGGSISINAHQHLDHIPASAWTLTIGGHQVAKKWLWDRRGRQLSANELTHYCQIITSLIRTRELMADIDRALEDHDGWPL